MTDVITLAAVAAAALGFGAGLLSMAAGFGGGLLLTLGLGVVFGPVQALIISAPGLLVGHVHRAWSLRGKVEPRTAKRFALAAIPGAVLGGLALVSIPPAAIWWILLAGALLAAVEATGMVSVKFGRSLTGPGGFSIGFLASAGGIGGILLPPVLMSAGLSGITFVATAAVGAVAVQLARITTYGATGLLSAEALAMSAVVAVGIIAGNLAGKSILHRMTTQRQKKLSRIVLAVCITLAAYGAAFG